MKRLHGRTSLPVGLALAALALTPAASQAQTFQPVMTGLDNPYGLAFSPSGGLYVAEAGTGNHAAGTGPGFVNGNNEQDFFGDTGAVSRYQGGVQTRVISGLPSLAAAGGVEATGLQGLAFDSTGNLYGAFGLGGQEFQRTQLVTDILQGSGAASTNAGDLGQIVRLNLGVGTVTPTTDLVPYETQNYATNNPGPTIPEANPYSLASLPGGGFAVSDGGGNVVLKAPTGGGPPTLLSVLPAQPNHTGVGPPAYQSVPTALAVDSHGGLFAAEFTGYPFPAGGASVFKLDPMTGAASVFAGGFTTITGLTFGPNGQMYVLDDTTNGLGPNPGSAQLFQVDPTSGARTLLASLTGGVDYSDLIAGPDGALYISDLGTGPGTGEVLRFVPRPCRKPPRRFRSACCWPWGSAGWSSPRSARRPLRPSNRVLGVRLMARGGDYHPRLFSSTPPPHFYLVWFVQVYNTITASRSTPAVGNRAFSLLIAHERQHP